MQFAKHAASLSLAVGVSVLAPSTSASSTFPGDAPDCKIWGTEEFFETTTARRVTACLAHGADLAVCDPEGNTPLHWAARVSNDPKVIDALLSAVENRARLTAVSSNPRPRGAVGRHSPASRLQRWRHRHHIARPHFAVRRTLNERNKAGHTALQLAVQHNNATVAVIHALLLAGADRHDRTPDGQTLLHLAARHNHNPQVIIALLSAGVDAAALDNHGNTPAIVAAENGNWPVLETLLRAEGQELLLDLDDTPFRDVNRFYINPLYWRDPEPRSTSLATSCWNPLFPGFSRQECNVLQTLGERRPRILLEARVGGDVDLYGQRAVRSLASRIAYAPSDRRRHHRLQIYASMVMRLRMMTSRSRPVLPPSFMPKATFQYIGLKRNSAKSIGMNVANVVLGHHSNGQTGCPFFGQSRDETGECERVEVGENAPLPLINYLTGNFSTHYIRGSWYHRWTALAGTGAIRRQISLGVGAEWHFNGGSGAMNESLRRRYGGRRLQGLFAVDWSNGFGIRLRGIRVVPEDNDTIDQLFRLEVEGVKNLRNDLAVYLRGLAGQDSYNIQFERGTARVEFGVVFGWGDIFRGNLDPSLGE